MSYSVYDGTFAVSYHNEGNLLLAGSTGCNWVILRFETQRSGTSTIYRSQECTVVLRSAPTGDELERGRSET